MDTKIPTRVDWLC